MQENNNNDLNLQPKDQQLLVDFIFANKNNIEWDDDLLNVDETEHVFDIINKKMDLGTLENQKRREMLELLGNFVSGLYEALDENDLLTDEMIESVEQIIESINTLKETENKNENEIVVSVGSLIKNMISKQDVREAMESYKSEEENTKAQSQNKDDIFDMQDLSQSFDSSDTKEFSNDDADKNIDFENINPIDEFVGNDVFDDDPEFSSETSNLFSTDFEQKKENTQIPTKKNLKNHETKINDEDKQLLIDFINKYRGEQMTNIEYSFGLLNGNINIDPNTDKHDLLLGLIYNLEINMEEDYLLDDSMRQKFSKIINLISNSKEELKNESEDASKVIETVGNFVKDIVSDPKKREGIEWRVKLYEDVYGPEEQNLDGEKTKMNSDISKIMKKAAEQRSFYISLSEGIENTKLDKSRTKGIVDNFIKLTMKEELDKENGKIGKNAQTIVEFVDYLKTCMNVMSLNASDESFKYMLEQNKIKQTQAEREHKYFSGMVKKCEYLIQKLNKASGKRDYTVAEKVFNFLKKFGSLMFSPIRAIKYGEEKITEAKKAFFSPLETKRQADFDSAFSDLKKELDGLDLDKIKENKDKNKNDASI